MHVGEARPDQVDVMLREGCFSKGLCHPNIHRLIATCFHQDQPPLLVYPFLDETNLKKFLQRCKISDVGLNQVWAAVLQLSIVISVLVRLQPLASSLMEKMFIYVVPSLPRMPPELRCASQTGLAYSLGHSPSPHSRTSACSRTYVRSPSL